MQGSGAAARRLSLFVIRPRPVLGCCQPDGTQGAALYLPVARRGKTGRGSGAGRSVMTRWTVATGMRRQL